MEYLIDWSNKMYTGTVALAGETAGGVRVRLDFFVSFCIKAKRKVKRYLVCKDFLIIIFFFASPEKSLDFLFLDDSSAKLRRNKTCLPAGRIKGCGKKS